MIMSAISTARLASDYFRSFGHRSRSQDYQVGDKVNVICTWGIQQRNRSYACVYSINQSINQTDNHVH